jgi:sugar/nucleoside kinase (ribokinase family)
MPPAILIAGTVAYDSIKTPYGNKEKILGGSGTHASVSASILAPVNLVSVIGEDFEQKYLDLFHYKGIDTAGIQVIKGGKTFFWSGFYENDMNQAHSLKTDLNVLLSFNPVLPDKFKSSKYVFLANIDPVLQVQVLDQTPQAKLTAMDTMNFWIDTKKTQLLQVISRINILLINDAEIRQLTGKVNIIQAARELINTGCKTVVVKKGEHGSLLITAKEVFAVPAYPLDMVKDPTGAGDSFAGGFMSWLAKTEDLSLANMRSAIVYGSTLASFNVEDFSCNRLLNITKSEINQRLAEYQKVCCFETLKI